jgi:hypothetical protein
MEEKIVNAFDNDIALDFIRTFYKKTNRDYSLEIFHDNKFVDKLLEILNTEKKYDNLKKYVCIKKGISEVDKNTLPQFFLFILKKLLVDVDNKFPYICTHKNKYSHPSSQLIYTFFNSSEELTKKGFINTNNEFIKTTTNFEFYPNKDSRFFNREASMGNNISLLFYFKINNDPLIYYLLSGDYSTLQTYLDLEPEEIEILNKKVQSMFRNDDLIINEYDNQIYIKTNDDYIIGIPVFPNIIANQIDTLCKDKFLFNKLQAQSKNDNIGLDYIKENNLLQNIDLMKVENPKVFFKIDHLKTKFGGGQPLNIGFSALKLFKEFGGFTKILTSVPKILENMYIPKHFIFEYFEIKNAVYLQVESSNIKSYYVSSFVELYKYLAKQPKDNEHYKRNLYKYTKNIVFQLLQYLEQLRNYLISGDGKYRNIKLQDEFYKLFLTTEDFTEFKLLYPDWISRLTEDILYIIQKNINIHINKLNKNQYYIPIKDVGHEKKYPQYKDTYKFIVDDVTLDLLNNYFAFGGK